MPKSILFLLCFCVFSVNAAIADEHAMHAAKASNALEQMKALEGSWHGTNVHDGKTEEAVVDYKVTAGGSAVIETLFPGTPHEMVSVYHDEAGKLAMTHYCMLGNQPHMALKKAGPNELDFDLTKNSGISSMDAHMHSLNIAFAGPDKITQTWAFNDKGKKANDTVITLERVKGSNSKG